MARRTATRALAPPARTEHHFRPADWARSYQKPVFEAFFLKGYDRGMLLWHRKAGKDLTALQVAKIKMAQRPGLVAHVFPTLKVGGEVVSQGITSQGTRAGESYLDAFPPELVKRHNIAEKLVELHPMNGAKTGSIYQVMGADNLQGRRGPNAVGVIISEFQDMDPAVWTSIFEPMILSNRGWVIFCLTPSETGRPHAEALWNMARSNPKWFTSFQTVDDTRMDALGEDGSVIVSRADLDASRAAGTPEESIQREYYCSFARRLLGSIFGEALAAAEQQGRVTRVPWDSQHPVGVMMDLGLDTYALIFYQAIAREIRLIDYYAVRGKDDAHIVHFLKERKPYTYGRLILPHDAAAASARPGLTAEQYYVSMRFRGVTVAEKLPVDVGIKGVRRLFPRMVFDAAACGTAPEEGQPSLLECLRSYRYPWNEEKKDYSGPPVHNQHSHGPDALRTGVVGDLEAPMVDGDPLDLPRHMRVLEDVLAPLSGRRRQAQHELSGWG